MYLSGWGKIHLPSAALDDINASQQLSLQLRPLICEGQRLPQQATGNPHQDSLYFKQSLYTVAAVYLLIVLDFLHRYRPP